MMIEHSPNPILPQYGLANQANVERALSQLADAFDPGVLSRRGRLYLLCGADADEDLTARIYTNYYTSARFDPMRNLCQAIQIDDSQNGTAVAGALIHNMTLYTVGTRRTRGWIWRNKRLIQVVPNPKGEAAGIPEGIDRIAGRMPNCDADQRRLYPGDSVILTDASADHKMSARLLRKAALYAASSDSFAKSLAQVLRSGKYPHPLVTVVQLPGSAATPELPPQSQIDYAYSGAADFAPHATVSPIVIAAFVAIIAIIAALIITKPHISGYLLRDIFIGTPAATETIQADQNITPEASPEATAQPGS